METNTGKVRYFVSAEKWEPCYEIIVSTNKIDKIQWVSLQLGLKEINCLLKISVDKLVGVVLLVVPICFQREFFFARDDFQIRK